VVPSYPAYALTRPATGETLAMFLDESEAERARMRFIEVRGWFDLTVRRIEIPARAISSEILDRLMDASARSE